MSSDKAALSIMLLNKEYRIACKDHERAALLESADFLNERMEEMKRIHRVAPPERLALMIALNLSNEFLSRRASGENSQAVREKIRSLCDRIDFVLDRESSAVEV